jgi:hypothetical protein
MLLASSHAKAMGAIVSTPPGSSSVSDERIAIAETPTRTTRWVSLHVHGTATSFAWIVPVKANGFLDLASDAWLESLEEATAPRVVPPIAPAPCSVNGGVDVEGDMSHVSTVAPGAVVVAPDGPTLVSTLSGWGLAMPSTLASAVDVAGTEGDSFVAMLYTQASIDVTTHTLRVVDASPATVPLAWMAGGSAIDVTTYTVLAGSPVFEGSVSLLLDPANVVWQAGSTSNYAALTSGLLTSTPGAWLVDTSASAPVFQAIPLPTGAPIDPLDATYFVRAQGYGDATGDPDSCTATATWWATSASPVAVACPAGALAQVGPDASCQETLGTGQLAPDAFRCGGNSGDLALALSGLAPASAWVSRSRAVLPAGSTGSDTTIATGGDVIATGPLVMCSGYASDVCASGSSSGGGTAGASGGGNAGGGGGGGGANGASSAAGDVLNGVASASDGCGGDSSGDSDDSSDGCSGDAGGDDGGDVDCSGGDVGDVGDGDCSLSRTGTRGGTKRSGTARGLMLLAAGLALLRRRGRRA